MGHWRQNGGNKAKDFSEDWMTCYGEKFQEILSILGSQGGVKSWSKYVNSGTSSEQQQEEQDSEFLSNVGSGYEKNQLLQLKFTHPGQKKKNNFNGSTDLLEQISQNCDRLYIDGSFFSQDWKSSVHINCVSNHGNSWN